MASSVSSGVQGLGDRSYGESSPLSAYFGPAEEGKRRNTLAAQRARVGCGEQKCCPAERHDRGRDSAGIGKALRPRLHGVEGYSMVS